MSPDIQELRRLAESARSAHEYGILLEGDHSETVMPNYYNAASPDTILALIEVAEAAQKLVSAVDDLISESHGVYGLHQNGDIAPWDTLTEGGQFEDWLMALSEARTALEGVKP